MDLEAVVEDVEVAAVVEEALEEEAEEEVVVAEAVEEEVEMLITMKIQMQKISANCF